MNKPLLVIMVGLPGSGKSTAVNWLLNEYKDKNFVILSTDDIIEIEAKKQGKTYSDIFKSYIKTATKIFNQQFIAAVNNNNNIIVDRTNLSRNARKIFLDKTPNYTKICIEVKIPKDELLKRLDKRAKETGKYIPPEVINDLENRTDIISYDEGFDKIIYF